MKKICALLLAIICVFTLTACAKEAPATATEATAAVPETTAAIVETTAATEEKVIIDLVIGCYAREEPDVLFVAEKLKDLGYNIQTQVFTDMVPLNMAVQDGEIDGNFVQHKPYLETFNKNNGTTLVAPVGPISTSNLGLYSRKYKTLEELPDGATIAISNDAAGMNRELLLLEALGLIELDPTPEQKAVIDITSNPKNLEIIDMQSLNKWGAFDDVDCITSQQISVYLMDDPANPSYRLGQESAEVTEQLAGITIVVAEENAEAQWVQEMYKIMTSDEYAQYLYNTYGGAKYPLFENNVFVMD